jgi:uncharacterized membrane protein
MNQEQQSVASGWSRSFVGLVIIAILAALSFYLYTRHRSHLFAILTYLLLFACPLFHLFMHGRHGGHSSRGHEKHVNSMKGGGTP